MKKNIGNVLLEEPWRIKYEDEHLVVVQKPAGLMVEPDRNNNPNLLNILKEYLLFNDPRQTYVQHLHRLDRPVSGLVLFVKNKACLRNLSEQFAFRTIKKKYKALTTNAPALKEGKLVNWHRKEKKLGKIVPEGTSYSNEVKLSYVIDIFEPNMAWYIWEIDLHTGKYHQIRAQLSHIGCPIVGDVLYGSNYMPLQKSEIALYAYHIEFLHPITDLRLCLEVDFDWTAIGGRFLI